MVALEGLGLLGFGVWLAVESLLRDASNEDVAMGSTVYFLVLGGLVLLIAYGLWRRSSFTHGAAVFLQLLFLPIAWYMALEGFWIGAVPLALGALAALVGLLRPDARAALGRD